MLAFEKEVIFNKALSHFHIVKFIEYSESDEELFLVFEFCIGGELFKQIVPNIGLPPDLVHVYFIQLCSAIFHLHSLGICHRDIKPENILIDRDGNLKLSDLGSATMFIKGQGRRILHSICGSRAYMSPEVLLGRYEGDSNDIWSLGIVLFVMITGCSPWQEPSSSCREFAK